MQIKSLRFMAAFAVLSCLALSAHGQADRAAWEKVEPPAFVSISQRADNPERIAVVFSLVTGNDGADRASVVMSDAAGKVLETKNVGRTRSDTKTVEFAPAGSGTYFFTVTAIRNGEKEGKPSQTKSFDFTFPLKPPVFRVLNLGGGKVAVKWNAVHEAEFYETSYVDPRTGAATILPVTAATETVVSGLRIGEKYSLSVAALRGSERVASPSMGKTIRDAADREWNFTWFGQSSNADLNTMTMLDADDLRFKLNSCSILSDGQIDRKGGKFTAFHDGISFYYTVIDPKRENFVLTATFTIDYINPTPDGQEGFGLLAMDSLGEHGVSMKNHYTNSAAIIATKFEKTINGVKKTAKDAIGARFVTGLTREVLAMGDSGIAQHGLSVSNAFGYENADLVVAGRSYTLTLKKTNTGYHAILANEYATEDMVTEYILYGPEKLLQLDADHVYVGFAVARGCNVTVSDVSMVITDPETDPPAQEEPPELVPLVVKVDSPTTFVTEKYPFVFTSNADGRITVTDKNRVVLVKNERVVAERDFVREFRLAPGFNDYSITFTPDPAYRPGAKQVMAAYDRELLKYVESYGPVSVNHSVLLHSYDNAELYVAPDGDFLGKGTKASPLDLETALAFSRPGQPVILAGGVYKPSKAVIIPRRNDGTSSSRKVLKSAPGERAVLDFSYASGGMQVWGNFWTIDGIDVRNTIGNVKGLQIGGNDNIVVNVRTYKCGDTGLQISGNSAEPYEKWPRNNLVLNCTSWDNCDPAANNADGFAAKLTCGDGNVFRGCIAYSNIDDGWDLFSKIESGPIGAVLIEDCVAFKNGSLSDGWGNGDGNGFKLGGDGIAVAHVVRNSIAFANGASGITSNSDPAIIVENCTSYANKGSNINLYGKGDGKRLFKARNNVSLKGGSADVIKEMPELASADNYFWNGARSVNSEGKRLDVDIFVNVEANTEIGRRVDGSIDMKGFLVLKSSAPEGIGARLR